MMSFIPSPFMSATTSAIRHLQVLQFLALEEQPPTGHGLGPTDDLTVLHSPVRVTDSREAAECGARESIVRLVAEDLMS